MAKMIVKNGKVQSLGGQLITDAGGAPCCCGDGCWIIALVCNCECPKPVVFRDSPELAEAWPYTDRLNGVVAEIDLSDGNRMCVEYAGSTSQNPGIGEFTPSHIVVLWPSCADSPCSDYDPCSGVQDGGQWQLYGTLGDACIPNRPIKCIQTLIVTTRQSGQYSDVDTGGGGTSLDATISSTGIVRFEYNGLNQLVIADWSYTGSTVGSRTNGGTPDNNDEWGLSKSYWMGDGSTFSPLPDDNLRAGRTVRVRFAMEDLGNAGPAAMRSIHVDRADLYCQDIDPMCSGSVYCVDDSSEHATTLSTHTTGLSGNASGFSETTWFSAGGNSQRTVISTSKSVSYEIITTDGVRISSDDCDIKMLIARRCDQPGDFITFDPATRPPDGVTMVVGESRYYPTLEPSLAPPVDVEWSTSDCDQPPMSIARHCETDAPIVFDPSTLDEPYETIIYNGEQYTPTFETSLDTPVPVEWSADPCPTDENWYKAILCDQPPDGVLITGFRYQASILPAGDGAVMVEYPLPLGGPNCKAIFAVQPTTQIADMSEFPGSQVFGDCANIGGVLSGCVSDPGDPSTRPEVPQSNTPGLGDRTKNAINKVARFATGGRVQEVKQCKGCKKRQGALNRFGERLK